MKKGGKPMVILMADDDEEDFMIIKDAFNESHFNSDLRLVEDGVELLDYLKRRNKYTDTTLSPCPHLILLDLNMPKKDGRKALQEIKRDPQLCSIPIIVLTTSKEEEDILQSYEMGASSFISKSASFEGMLKIASAINRYWFEVVELPSEGTQC